MIHMPDEDNSFDTTHEINTAIREGLKQTKALKITDMAGMNSIAVGINEVGKITVEGNAGDYFGAFNGAANLRLVGNADNYPGDNMSGGIIRIEGNVGYGTGSYLTDGTLNVSGNAGPCLGQRMYGGVITVKGSTASLTGLAMKDGFIFVDGKCGDDTGHKMVGGVIYARGFKSLGDNAIELPLTKIDKSRLMEYLETDELDLDKFTKVVAENDETQKEDSISVKISELDRNYLDNLKLTSSFPFYDIKNLETREDVDLSLEVGTALGVKKLKNPLMIYDTGTTNQAMLKQAHENGITVITNSGNHKSEKKNNEDSENPIGVDILRLSPDREGVNINSIVHSKGIECVLGSGTAMGLGGELISDRPERQLDINTKEDIVNFIELLREITVGTHPIFFTVCGENIYDTVFELCSGKPDAIILKSSSPAAAVASASEAIEDTGNKDEIKLFSLGKFHRGEEIMKLVALGANGVALVFPVEGAKVSEDDDTFSLSLILKKLKILVAYSGHKSMEQISKEDIRAGDYTTAAVTGTKLIGYDQKLPIWRQ